MVWKKNDAINDAEFKGNILLLLREAMAFVKANTRKGWEKLPDGRKNKPEYAERAVLETMVNHFIHRDYTIMGGEVHLDIYDDRIAVTSLGGMYSGQIVQDIPVDEVSSNRRNPILADVMAQLDYMEKRGSGLKRICNETKELDGFKEELNPVFRSTMTQFATILYSIEYGTREDVIDEVYQRNEQASTKLPLSSHQVITKLSLSIPKTIDLLQKMMIPLSAKEMRLFCGQKDPTHFKKKFIDPLITEGMIAMTQPDSPKSPTQKYYLTDFGKGLLKTKSTDNKEMNIDKIIRLISDLNDDEKRIVLNFLQK